MDLFLSIKIPEGEKAIQAHYQDPEWLFQISFL